MLSSISFRCRLSSKLRPGWKHLLKISSTIHLVMTARPTAVISCFPVLSASMLTNMSNHCGTVRQSFRMLNERLLIAPLRRLNLVMYSLSSRAVRDCDMRWFATAFCSCSIWELRLSICVLPSKYRRFTFLYLVTGSC
ncbi:hypothetical protein CTA2_12675 [Colletotrichum tanaceti]|nr:hypothetical protein CTA2_12675 [Colletotrichum tanaceti]